MLPTARLRLWAHYNKHCEEDGILMSFLAGPEGDELLQGGKVEWAGVYRLQAHLSHGIL